MTNIRRFMRELVELERAKKAAKLPEMEQRTVKVINIGASSPETEEVPFLDLVPDWLTRPPKEIRLLQDWQDSSAGRGGFRFCDHWVLGLSDYEYKGERCMHCIPRWGDKDGNRLPKVNSGKCKTVYGLMEKLQEFDRKAGYPFAWYFYMLHGNRLGDAAGERVAEAVESGQFRIPVHDEKVLQRWCQHPYGF